MDDGPSAPHPVDRLWPDPAAGLPLDAVTDGYEPPTRGDGRTAVAINMVTSVDGRAQLNGTAEGLGSRADRLLMRRYRAAFDAVGSGVGTLRATGVWLRVGDELADRREADGKPRNPTGVVIAGSDVVPTDASWFDGDESRLLVVGRDNPLAEAPAGTELLRAPTETPEPAWVLDRLAERGVRSLLLEGGPHVNASFLASGHIDEIMWTVGALVTAADALPMIAAPPPGVLPSEPRRVRLAAVHRHEDELFLRYRFDEGG
jgi:riboflavin biosynthesis pyrimidine reductase